MPLSVGAARQVLNELEGEPPALHEPERKNLVGDQKFVQLHQVGNSSFFTRMAAAQVPLQDLIDAGVLYTVANGRHESAEFHNTPGLSRVRHHTYRNKGNGHDVTEELFQIGPPAGEALLRKLDSKPALFINQSMLIDMSRNVRVGGAVQPAR